MVSVVHGEDHDENRQRVYDWSTSAKHLVGSDCIIERN